MNKVIVTTSWDDGHVLDMKLAALLRKYGLKGTFYISPLDRQMAPEERLTSDQILELSKNFEIGAHTMTHPDLSQLSDREAGKEILDSKKYLEKIIRKPVVSFCYPYGKYTKRQILQVKKAGFYVARTVNQMITKIPKNYFEFGTSLEFSPTSFRGILGQYKLAVRNLNFSILRRLTLDQKKNALNIFDHVCKSGGIYHLWGHSSLIAERGELEQLEEIFQYISGRNNVEYLSNGEINEKNHLGKIVKVIQTPARYYPYIGGVEKYVSDLSYYLARKNNTKIKIYCADEPKAQNILGKVEVKRLSYIAKIANTNITPLLFWELIKTQFDIIHSHIPTPWSADISMCVAWIKRKPFLLTYHNDISTKGPFGFIGWLYNNTFLKLVLYRANAIVVTQKKYIDTSKYLLQFKEKIRIIPNGVDIEKVHILNISRKDNTIFFLSSLDRYHKYKGLDILLKSVSIIKQKNPNVYLRIGGDGELIKEYSQLVGKLGINSNVEFLGRIDEESKNRYYQESMVFALPSNGFEEGFGIVLLEAMANATPVITTRYAGVADDIIKSQAGYVVGENNAIELAEKISLLLSDRQLVSKMGERGYNLVRDKYSYKIIAEKMYQLYLQLI